MPDGVKTTIYLPAALRDRIAGIAKTERRSVNAQIVQTLEKAYTGAVKA